MFNWDAVLHVVPKQSSMHCGISWRKAQTSELVLKFDFWNAFNTLYRSILLETVKYHALDAYLYFVYSYVAKNPLHYEHHVIWSQTRVQQEDILGLIGFALALNPISQSLELRFNAWYLDYVTLGGDPDIVMKYIVTLIRDATRVGLEINPSKCELLVLNATDVDSMWISRGFARIAPGL